MFEIMKALMALQEACKAHGTSLRWYLQEDEPDFPALMAEIPLTADDVRFVQDMQRMFEPKEG